MSTGRIQFAEQDGTFVLKFVGEVRLTLCSALDATIERIFTALNFNAIVIDLTETRSIDSTTLGLLAKLSILSRQKIGLLPTVVTTHEDITRLLESMGFDQVFNIIGKPIPCPECLTDLPSQDQTEEVVRLTLCSALDATIERIFTALNFSAIVIDLTETRSIDSTTLGLLAKLSILSRQKVGLLPTVVTTHEDITRLLQSMGFDQVFNIIDKPIPCPECLTDLPSQDQSEEVVRVKVLEAHKILMGLNDSNREAFHDLVNALERH